MPEENPYRYEGSAESLEKPKEAPSIATSPSGVALFCAGFGAAIVAGLIVSMFYKEHSPAGALVIAVAVLLPIGIFNAIYARKRDIIIAQVGYWIAALPLALYWYFGMPTEKHWSAAIIRDIAKYMLISYGSEVLAAATILGYLTYRVPRHR